MDLPIKEGDLVAGKYVVERVLGDGGMGFVVAARHLELGERVALKFLLPEVARIPEARIRFVREARAAARIKGERVARVLDVGTREDGLPFIVMEHLEGNDLGRLLEKGGAFSVTDAVHAVLQACEAVAQAHALGIVHRDLKPANLFLTTSADGSPLVKVLDFGISKCTSVFARTLSPDLTTVNEAVGTPGYMSPEQARDAGKVDTRTDVWGLGTILYELLAGKPAFDGDSVPAIVMMIATEEPQALETLRADVPMALAGVVQRCLRKSREERFANVADLARALAPFAPEEARHAVSRIARILGHDSVPPPTTVDNPPSIRERGRRWPTVVLALGAVLVLLLGAFAVQSKREASPPVAATALTRPPTPAAPIHAAPETTPTRDVPSAASVKVPTAAPLKEPRAFDSTKAATVPGFDGGARRLEQRFNLLSPDTPGTLTFEANVPADVVLDGSSLGQVPKSVSVAPGAHTIVFVHPELGEKAHTVTLESGQEKTIRATFEPRTTAHPE